MKKSLFLSLMLTACLTLSAQTFTQTNDDGVEIKYTVTTDNHVKIEANGYSGRVVVPQSVTYEGTTYEVNEASSAAFYSLQNLTYVQLPSTLTILGYETFRSCGNLDTVVFLCNTPPLSPSGSAFSPSNIKYLFGNNLIENIVVIVPSGQLATWKRTAWGSVPLLSTPSAIPITILTASAIKIYAEGILLWENRQPAYYNRYYEYGDSAHFNVNCDVTDTVFLGWDNDGAMTVDMVVTEADTLRPIVVPMGYAQLSVNNVSTPIKFNGQMGFLNNQANYYFPNNSFLSPLYANGLWIGGKVLNQDAVYTAATRFHSGDYLPGPLATDGTLLSTIDVRSAYNRVWSVSRDEIDDFIAHVGESGYSIPENILSWPGNGEDGYAVQLAPYYDADSDGVYDPHHGDYPLIRGDRMLFSIFNDVSSHETSLGNPMGIEIHASAYAFNESDNITLNNTVFLSFKIINRSLRTYDSVYFGSFTDFDLGYCNDDFIGCDVGRGMSYAYNGDEEDGPGMGAYDGVPPAQSCTVLAGATLQPDGVDNPKIDIEKMQQFFPEELSSYLNADGSYDTARLSSDANLYYPSAWYFSPDDPAGNNAINGSGFGNGVVDDERLGMCHFIYYMNSIHSVYGEPYATTDYYNYLHGKWRNGQRVCFGGDGCNSSMGAISTLGCNFMFPGDSDPWNWGTNGVDPHTMGYTHESWSESNEGNVPGDRRGVASSGPFTLAPGEEQTLDLAFTTAQGTTTAWSSVETLGRLTDGVRSQWNRDTTDGGRPFTYRPYSAPIAAIENVSLSPSVTVYPNPAKDMVTVALGEGLPMDISLYDLRGLKVMEKKKVQGVVHLNIRHLQGGVYVLHCGEKTARIIKY